MIFFMCKDAKNRKQRHLYKHAEQERRQNMNKEQLQTVIDSIRPLDKQAYTRAEERQAALVKPPGSLGQLEAMSIRLAGITGKVKNEFSKPAVLIMAADNGVVAQGISSAPQSVTISQTINFTRRLTGVGALARTFDVDLLVTDVGINAAVPAALRTYDTREQHRGRILDRKVAMGTKDLSLGSAMTEEEALQAMAAGCEVVQDAAMAGYDLIGLGEMGIGNTTTSTAILAALTDVDPAAVTGRGGGLTDACLARKIDIIKEAASDGRRILAKVATAAASDPADAMLSLFARCGGFDICAMTGAYLQAAALHLPVVIDGYISVVSALCAATLAPRAAEYMFASHVSEEPGYLAAIRRLGLHPVLDMDMRLGEGSGCILAFQLLRAACGVMNHMATFAEADINDDYLAEIR